MKSWRTIWITSVYSAWPTRGGGYESLIPANQPEHIAAIRPQGEIDFSGTLIRLHIGLEDVDDLIADLDAGFARIV